MYQMSELSKLHNMKSYRNRIGSNGKFVISSRWVRFPYPAPSKINRWLCFFEAIDNTLLLSILHISQQRKEQRKLH